MYLIKTSKILLIFVAKVKKILRAVGTAPRPHVGEKHSPSPNPTPSMHIGGLVLHP